MIKYVKSGHQIVNDNVTLITINIGTHCKQNQTCPAFIYYSMFFLFVFFFNYFLHSQLGSKIAHEIVLKPKK